MSEPFIAEIKIFAGNFAPRGYAFCDGQLLPIAQNTALFSLLGTTFGGDGRTTVGLPNLQGKAAMHPGRGPGLTARRLGQRGGVEGVVLPAAQMPNHTHIAQASTTQASQLGPANLLFGTGPTAGRQTTPLFAADTETLVNMQSGSLGNTGGGQSHTNEQPYIALNYIIALVGVYPSRS